MHTQFKMAVILFPGRSYPTSLMKYEEIGATASLIPAMKVSIWHLERFWRFFIAIAEMLLKDMLDKQDRIE